MTTEIEKRNLVNIIHECLREHEVSLKDDAGRKFARFLIEVNSAKSSAFEDFMATYGNDVDDFRRKIAEKVMGSRNSRQVYGVLIDPSLTYTFAFNRSFADLDKKKRTILFRSPEEVLIEIVKGKKIGFSPEENDLEDLGGGFDADTVIRYSLIGRKGRKSGEVQRDEKFERGSLIDRIKKEYMERTVDVKIGEEENKFFLVPVKYHRSVFTDFMATNGNDVDDFRRKIAEKVMGSEKNENEYSLLISMGLQIKFAFNNLFASYNPERREVVYHTAEEAVLKCVEGRDVSKIAGTFGIKIPKASNPGIIRRPSGGGRGGTLMRYALIGKND